MSEGTRELAVIINGERTGELRQDLHGQIEFQYAHSWMTNPNPTPLSLSMSLAVSQRRNKIIDPWLRGLLPDNDAVLDR